MSFPRYSAYKESGVEWLGRVPSTWGVKRIKHTTYLKGRVGWKGLTSEEYLEDGYAYLVTGTDFSRKFINWTECHFVDVERYQDDPFIQLSDGDLLITKDGTIGKLALVAGLDRPACLNSGIFLVRPQSDYVTDFMYWVLQSAAFKTFCDLSSLGSTIQHLYQNVFERFAFPVPTLDEQQGVAAFLDRETAKIDALVAEQEQLITLLKEKRQAVISHAVTKGLDPSVPMKDSGVEWLGEVPAHWQVCTLRRLIKRIEQGWSPECEAQPADENSWGVLKAGCVNRGVFNPEENKTLPDSLDPLPEYEVHEGDILMSRASGSPELVGSTAFVYQTRPRLMLSDKIFRIHLEAGQNRSFFVWSMNAKHMREQIEQALSGGNGLANNLPQSVLLSFVCAVPPEAEQLAISCALDQESAQIDQLTAEAVLSIELLRERRAALISAAVTGQIDVRTLEPVHAA